MKHKYLHMGNQYVDGLKQHDGRVRNPVVVPVPNRPQTPNFQKRFLFEQQIMEERMLAARAAEENNNLMHGSSFTSDSGPVSQQLDYGNVIRRTYPTAVTAENFGLGVQSYIQSVNAAYTPSNVLFSSSVCSDDVNGPVFGNINNLGQMPQSLQTFLGPFMGGGLDGYPHTGTTGLLAYASHVTSGGALFLYIAPHIGITRDGQVGYMRRRGQRYDDLSATCGAAAAAVSWIRTNGAGGAAPQWPNPSDALLSNASDYQFYVLVKAIYDDATARAAICATSDFGQQMVLATEAIRNSAYNIIAKPDDNSTFKLAYRTAFPSRNVDVFLSTGTFINVDDGSKAYADVTNFAKYNKTTDTFEDVTAQFKSRLQLN
jgi:hypothetical protein